MAAKKARKKLQKHIDRTTTAYAGPVHVDASTVAAILVDLPQGARQGLRKSGPGIDAVASELAGVMSTAGAEVGIGQALYDTFTKHHKNASDLAQIGTVLFKLAEVVQETLALEDDAREQALAKIVDIIKSAAKRDKNEGLKAPFHETLAYKGEAAQKANKTKADNKAKAATPATPAAH